MTKKQWNRIVKNEVIYLNMFLLSSGKTLSYILKET